MKQLARRQAETMGWPILEPLDAEGVERPVALSTEVCVAGVREHVNLKLQSSRVSRTHALFVADRDSIYLRDLASRNHTYLNDEPIREAVLRNGDVIGLGPVTFRCQSGFDRPYEKAEIHAPAAELRQESDDSRFPLPGRTALIGNRSDCDIHVPGDDVAPAHAVIYEREGRRFIRDLQSQGHTLVNEEPVKETELQPGDRIRIGETNLIYQTVSQAEHSTASLPLLEDFESENGIGLGDVSLPENTLAKEEDLPAQDADEPPTAAADALNLSQPSETESENPIAAAAPDHENVIPFALESEESEQREQSGQTDAPGDKVAMDAPDEELDLEPDAAMTAPMEDLEALPSIPSLQDASDHAIMQGQEAMETEEDLPSHADLAGPDDGPHDTPGAEKLTELLGELVETVSKVQSTWEDIRGGAEHPIAEDHERRVRETSP